MERIELVRINHPKYRTAAMALGGKSIGPSLSGKAPVRPSASGRVDQTYLRPMSALYPETLNKGDVRDVAGFVEIEMTVS